MRPSHSLAHHDFYNYLLIFRVEICYYLYTNWGHVCLVLQNGNIRQTDRQTTGHDYTLLIATVESVSQ
jgi:hypothetical protein